MSSYSDWLFSLELKAKPLPPIIVNGTWLLLFLLLLGIASTLPYLLLAYAAYLYWLHHCYLFFVCLNHPNSPKTLTCQKGLWEIGLVNGQNQQALKLSKYFLSANTIVLHFLCTQKIYRFQFWKNRNTVMIFPSQVGETEFRHLYRLLKFQNKELLPTNLLAKTAKAKIKKEGKIIKV